MHMPAPRQKILLVYLNTTTLATEVPLQAKLFTFYDRLIKSGGTSYIVSIS